MCPAWTQILLRAEALTRWTCTGTSSAVLRVSSAHLQHFCGLVFETEQETAADFPPAFTLIDVLILAVSAAPLMNPGPARCLWTDAALGKGKCTIMWTKWSQRLHASASWENELPWRLPQQSSTSWMFFCLKGPVRFFRAVWKLACPQDYGYIGPEKSLLQTTEVFFPQKQSSWSTRLWDGLGLCCGFFSGILLHLNSKTSQLHFLHLTVIIFSRTVCNWQLTCVCFDFVCVFLLKMVR